MNIEPTAVIRPGEYEAKNIERELEGRAPSETAVMPDAFTPQSRAAENAQDLMTTTMGAQFTGKGSIVDKTL